MTERVCLSAPLVNLRRTPSASGSEDRGQLPRIRLLRPGRTEGQTTDAEGDEDVGTSCALILCTPGLENSLTPHRCHGLSMDANTVSVSHALA